MRLQADGTNRGWRPTATDHSLPVVVSPFEPDQAPLRLVLERVQEDLHEPEFVTEVPLVGFAAFAADKRVFGWVRLGADRLTDLLNAHEEVRLVHVDVEDLRTGETRAVDQVVVQRRDLVAVQASGPRGDPNRRQRTRAHPLAVQSGPYLITGFLHAAPGVAPLADVAARPPMVPLTSACVEYWADGARRRQWVGTIVFNRALADWIEPVAVEDLEFGEIVPRGMTA